MRQRDGRLKSTLEICHSDIDSWLDDFRKEHCKRRAGRCQPRTSLEAAEKCLRHHETFKRKGEIKVS
jgi:hypothetical protein